MQGPLTAPVAAGSLLGGYLTGRITGVRALAGVVLVAGGGWCARSWYASQGAPLATGLTAAYLAAFGLSHPLAKRIGAWPSVLAVSAVAGGTAYVFADRRS